MENNTPKLYGLVLAGGKSTRMGADKGLLNYHGVPQQEYLYNLLSKVCDQVFLSIRTDQQSEIPKDFQVIVDQNEYRGPFNGMLSAHKAYPEVAWLVVACDLPLLDLDTIQNLVKSRKASKLSTSYATKASGLPEPLITIWEPSGLDSAMEYLKNTESSCPRKFLINSEISLVHPERDETLYNANSLEEFEYAKTKIGISNEP